MVLLPPRLMAVLMEVTAVREPFTELRPGKAKARQHASSANQLAICIHPVDTGIVETEPTIQETEEAPYILTPKLVLEAVV